MRSRLIILAGLALAMFSGTAAAQSSGPLAAGCTRARVRRDTPYVDRRRPAEVRRDSLAQAVRDSVLAGIMHAARRSGVAEPAGEVVIELRDRTAGTARAFAGSNVPLEVIQTAVDGAAPLLARWPLQDDYFHLVLDPLPSGAPLAVGDEYVECRPVPLNGDEIRAAFDQLVHNDTAFSGRVDLTVTYLVDRTGRVFYARVARGTAHPDAREAVLALTRRAVLRPASVAGRPVSLWVQQNYQFTFRR